MEHEELHYFDPRICVIGQSNLIRPIVRQFSNKYKTMGFDIKKGYTDKGKIERVRQCNFFIIAVSTTDELKRASEIAGKAISGGDIVVYDTPMSADMIKQESIPVIEQISLLEYNIQFFACIRDHLLVQSNKTTTGCLNEVGKIVDEIYSSVINKSVVFDFTNASNVV